MSTHEYKIVAVTPAMAEKWLKKNHPDNRAVSWQRVESYANDMRTEKWVISPQGIIFDADGFLIDGQHRLHAIVLSKMTVKIAVFEGHDLSIHGPLDRGMPRSIGTILGMHGRHVSAINVLRMLEQGCHVNVPMTTSEAQLLNERYAKLFEVFYAGVKGKQKFIGPLVGACLWAMPCDQDKVIDFANKVVTGEMIAKRDPAFVFRLWKEKNLHAPAWPATLAVLNCLRYHLHGLKLSAVFTGEMGYRGITTRRRALKVPYTPDANMVPTVSYAPKMDGSDS